MLKRLEMVLHGGHVVRFHTKPTLKEETVAEHSYLVAWLIALMYGDAVPRAELLLAALAHDLPEHVLGDMPSPAKISLGLRRVFREQEASLFEAAGMPDYEGMLDDGEDELLKFCDNMAGYLKCRYEAQLGNRHLHSIALRYREYLEDNIRRSTGFDKGRAMQLLLWAMQEPLTAGDKE
jgi:5'-deoxynucleotidase YfbR-like HD superfamily hydrolase